MGPQKSRENFATKQQEQERQHCLFIAYFHLDISSTPSPYVVSGFRIIVFHFLFDCLGLNTVGSQYLRVLNQQIQLTEDRICRCETRGYRGQVVYTVLYETGVRDPGTNPIYMPRGDCNVI